MQNTMQAAQETPDLGNHQAGEVWEQRTSKHVPVNLRLFRSSGDRWSDTVDIQQHRDFITDELLPVEISAASWNGGIEETKTFIAVLQKAVELAEARQREGSEGNEG